MSNSHKNVLLENNIQSSNTTAMGFLTMWPRAESGEKILIEHTGGSQTYKTNPLHPDDRRAIEEFVKAQMPKRKIVIETHDKH